MGTVIAFKPHDGQYWRLVTPIFLHFGWLHIIFNSLWIWELAGLVESRLGWARLLLLVLVCAAGSNITQAVVSGPSLFGGMSGVVYGLLGFCWVYQSLQPRAGLQIPQGILLFMLGWLVLCMVVPTQSLGIGAVANGAHLGGLIIGCLVAGLVGLGARLAK
jgi:GlpG protein